MSYCWKYVRLYVWSKLCFNIGWVSLPLSLTEVVRQDVVLLECSNIQMDVFPWAVSK